MTSIPRTKTADRALQLDDSTAAEVAILVQALRTAVAPSELVVQERALKFAYDLLAKATESAPSFSAFFKIANQRYGWSNHLFQSFAELRTWSYP